MADYAAYLLNQLEVIKDRTNAYERVEGKSGTVLTVEIGEKLMWKVEAKQRMK